jgi:hypothetical protein
VIVYSDRAQTVGTRQLIADLETLSGIDHLIARGQLEAGVVDAVSPEVDEDSPVTLAVRIGEIAATEVAQSSSIREPGGYR